MAYLGNTPQTQGFTPAVDYFSGNGSTVTFTLTRPVAAAVQVEAVIDNVVQNPSTAYTVSGNAITFTSAPLSGTNNIYVRYTSLITTYAAISQSPSVIGDITASGGYLSTGSFNNSFLDGTIVDYVTGNGRITVGSADGLTIYTGGTSARSALMTLDSSGNMGIGTTSPSGNLHVASSGFTKIVVQNTTNSVIGRIQTESNDFLIQTDTNHPLSFAVANGASQAGIDTSGNFKFNSGYGSSAIVYGCRAWVNFNGNPTLAIRGSGNVSSVTRSSTGVYTVNFTNALSDANYATFVTANRSASGVDGYGSLYGAGTYTASAVQVLSAYASSATLQDAPIVCVSVFR